jgi:HlyD family secretion protein
MDIARPTALRNKRIKQSIYGLIVLIAAGAASVGLSRMKPAAPSVDRSTVWIDTVKRGEMLRQVRGLGTLVPEEVRWIPATTDGIIEEVRAMAGDSVKADTIILVMSNPDVLHAATDAELAVKSSEADLLNLRATLRNQIVNQQSEEASVESEYKQAQLDLDVNQQLWSRNLISELLLKKSQLTVQELAQKYEMEKKKVQINSESADAQIAAQQTRVEQYRAVYELRKKQLEELNVRAGAAGVIQQVPVEAGQRVMPGTILAKVAEPGRLKAELQVAETQAKDVVLGQFASIDTRNGIIQGQVMRIDPASVNGNVKVDVHLKGEYPKGARPDLSVDGTIDIERIPSVLYVGRPAFGQADSTVGIFRLMPNGEASRIHVRLGRTSVNTIEIVDGLREGDQVVLSDMSAWDSYDRVRLN